MRQIAAFAAAALLSGCGVWSSTIRSNVLDYSNVIADTSNKFLLVNILEAKDNAPLQFVEMPKISGTLQASAALPVAVPFFAGTVDTPAAGSILSGTVTPGITVQSTPTFEVDNLDTKEFAQGMTSSIDPKQVKYWIGKGLDKRILLLLFFSSVKITTSDCGALKPISQTTSATAGNKNASQPSNTSQSSNEAYALCVQKHGISIIVQNDPRRAADALVECEKMYRRDFNRCHAITGFEHYLRMINDMQEGFTANTYGERALIAKDVNIDMKELASFDPDKYEVEYVTDTLDKQAVDDTPGNHASKSDGTAVGKAPHYNVYSATEGGKIALCFRGEPIADSGEADPAECTRSVVTDITNTSDETNELTPAQTTKKSEILPDTSEICDGVAATPPASPSPYCVVYLGYLKYLEAVEKLYKIDADEEPVLASKIEDKTEDRPALGKAIAAGEAHYKINVAIRSTGEIVRFLGDVLYYQEHVPENIYRNSPLTVGYSEKCHEQLRADPSSSNHEDIKCAQADDGYLFRVNGKNSPRFSVNYRGHTYAVGQSDPTDHTLEVLAVLSLSVALNRSASDISPTQLIQAIP